jgi:hypothetical protein
MRWSSGSVSALTSMTGGWYVWIMDMGRDERESERERDCWWPGEGEARSLLYVSRAVADCAKAEEDGGALVGEAGAGDAGPGDALVDGGCFCRWAAPPHCDMKDRTVAGTLLVYAVASETRPGHRGGDRSTMAEAAFNYLSWGGP